MRTALIVSTALLAMGQAIAGQQTGEEVYQAVCNECHATGKHGSPKFGDRKRWGRLVKEGLDDLVPAALGGVRKMPAKGGKPELEDIEVARGVVYMANAGGGHFAEPTASDVVRWRAIADKHAEKRRKK